VGVDCSSFLFTGYALVRVHGWNIRIAWDELDIEDEDG